MIIKIGFYDFPPFLLFLPSEGKEEEEERKKSIKYISPRISSQKLRRPSPSFSRDRSRSLGHSSPSSLLPGETPEFQAATLSSWLILQSSFLTGF